MSKNMAMIFINVLMSLLLEVRTAPSEAPSGISSDPKRYCGKNLSSAVSMLCFGNDNRRKRSLENGMFQSFIA